MDNNNYEEWTDDLLCTRGRELRANREGLSDELVVDLEDLDTEVFNRFCAKKSGDNNQFQKVTPSELGLIRTFSGTGDNMTCWQNMRCFLHQIKTVAGPDKNRQLQEGRTRLCGRALLHAIDNPEMLDSYKAFEQGLQKRFGMNFPRTTMKKEFSRLEQTPSESRSAFAGRIREVGLLIWQSQAPEVQRNRTVEMTAQFLRGLNDETLKRSVALLNPKNLEGAVEIATRLAHTLVPITAEEHDSRDQVSEQDTNDEQTWPVDVLTVSAVVPQEGKDKEPKQKRGRPTARSIRYRRQGLATE
jgi:hypothetical protein